MAIDNSKQVHIPAPQDFIKYDVKEDMAPVMVHFASWAAKSPERLALCHAGQTLSYGELNAKVNQLANHLLHILGDGEEPVGILFGKDIPAIIAILATLKAGKIYTGLDPANPVDSLKTICNDLKPRVILTSSLYVKIAQEVAGNEIRLINVEQPESLFSSEDPITKVSSDRLAAIYYTSGSTGEPKGVMVDHRTLWCRTYMGIATLKISPSDRICLPFPVGLGWSASPLFGALTTGASLFLYDFSEKSVIEVAEWFTKNKITYTPIPPSFFRQFITALPDDYGSNFPDMRAILIGGEVLHPHELTLWQKRFSPNCIIRYGLSSTESGPITHAHYTTGSIVAESSLTFGMPSPGVSVFIMNEEGDLVPNGTMGEIVVQSDALLSGYWKKEFLNQKVFLSDPENPEKKLFRTGDMGCIDESGSLEFLGRKDTQVKIRGFRVDLAGIASIIRSHPMIHDAVVVSRENRSKGARLIAYIVFLPGLETSSAELKKYLAAKLPPYMLPAAFHIMAALPYNATGKVISSSLPPVTGTRPELESPYIAPRKEIEINIANIWKKILELDQVGIQDNFFDLGGDSLSAMDMTLEVEKLLSKPIPALFFKKPTISYLTTLIDSDPGDESGQSYIRAKNKKNKTSMPKLKDLANRRFSLDIVDRLADLMIARWIVSMPYIKAKEWAVNWSQNSFARNFVYKRRYDLLSRLSVSLDNEPGMTPETFQRSIVTNLSFGMSIYFDNEAMDKGNSKANSEKYNYWRSLSDLIEKTPKEDLPGYFPVNGLEHLLNAQREGKGVILLTAHSITSPIRFKSLSKQINMEIPTISYRTPIRQSEYRENPKGLPQSIGSTMNAEIAIRGQKLLQQGLVINIVGDTSDPYGQSHHISIGGRAYQMKSGFAELALNTGAAIIPHYGGCLSDGRPELNFLPPFVPINGTRNAQVESLVAQYTAFINDIWKKYPEVLHWRRIRTHFSRPNVQE